MDFYQRKSAQIAAQTLPVLTDVFATRGEQIENIVVPFTDGLRGLQVAANLKKAVETDGKEIFKSFEKGVVLSLIDEAWKEHLREMDDLKQSVQNAEKLYGEIGEKIASLQRFPRKRKFGQISTDSDAAGG